MKKIWILLFIAVAVLAPTSCKYDDSDLWDSIEQIDERLTTLEQTVAGMNTDISSMQEIVGNVTSGGVITNITESDEGYTITFNNDRDDIFIKHGTDGDPGSEAPVIGVKEHEEEFYWTITVDGEEKWLPDSDTPQLKVSGHTPVLNIDQDGYWTVDGTHIEIDGAPVKATGTQGDPFFSDVSQTDDTIVFTLQNGTTLIVPFISETTGPDYSDPDGVFLLNEGNKGSQDGTIVWYDGSLNEYRKIYENANNGRTPGNVLQDMFIANGKVYLVCQNGNVLGGDGQLLICDLKTMKLQQVYNNLDFDRHESQVGCPQHIVVVGNKAFIQYASDNMETYSGIRVFNLVSGTLRSNDIPGTYGTFGRGTDEKPTGGALKARMLYSRGKIIAGLAKGVVFIDPGTETVTHTLTFDGGVKDIVKGADGNLYIAVTGDFTTPQANNNYASPTGSKMYKYSHDGELISVTPLDGITFTTAPAIPNIGMSASFTEPYLYFRPDMFNYNTYMSGAVIARYDYSTETVVKEFVEPAMMTEVYGYTGVHPTAKQLFACVNNIGAPGTVTGFYAYDISGPTAPDRPLKSFTMRNYTGSPTGVFFTYSFSDSYFAK